MDNKVSPVNGDAGSGQDARLRKQQSEGSQQELVSNGQPAEVKVETTILRKSVGLIGGISMIVGTMIGSGIFISPKGVVRGSGSTGLSLIVWTLCGALAMLGALSYAELGTFIRKSGAEYAYLNQAFGSVPAFLFSWVSVLVIRPSSVAIISMTCAEYVLVPLFDDGCGEPPVVNKKILAAIVIILITAVNCYSVELATRIQIFFTAAKLIALVIIIIGGIVMLAQGSTTNLNPSNSFQGTESNIGKIALGFYNGMWAYDGWNNLNFVTEEIINPKKNLPRAILIGIPLVIVTYILVNISYFTVLSPQQLLDSPAVAVTFGAAVWRPLMWILPIFVAMSTFGATNGSLFTGGRLTYVAARDGNLVQVLSMIHVTRYTPLPSLVATMVIALLMVIPADIGSLIDFFNFTAWIFYGGTMAALLYMRWKFKDEPRPYKVPIFIPVIVLLASGYLVLAPIINNPQLEFLYASIFIVGGLIFYVPFVHFKKELPCMDYLTLFLQMVLQVAPPSAEPEM